MADEPETKHVRSMTFPDGQKITVTYMPDKFVSLTVQGQELQISTLEQLKLLSGRVDTYVVLRPTAP